MPLTGDEHTKLKALAPNIKCKKGKENLCGKLVWKTPKNPQTLNPSTPKS